MSYLGENFSFSFRDNFCEPVSASILTSASIAEFGRRIARLFTGFTIGCENDLKRHLLFSLCSGIAECGNDVFMCEKTDLQSFKYGLSLTSSDCGIFISGLKSTRISFFNGKGFPIDSDEMIDIMNSRIPAACKDCGTISSISSLQKIYSDNIKKQLEVSSLPLKGGISCGNRDIRILWQEFFKNHDDSFIFQVSDDGQRVNAYDSNLGFISYERLILAYAIKIAETGETVYLPENFHFAADNISRTKNLNIKKFNILDKSLRNNNQQRFLNDSLFLCTQLLSDHNTFYSIIKSMPKFASAKRETVIRSVKNELLDKAILEPQGRVYLSKSGKNRISILAQSYDNETAAELCSLWSDKLKKLSSCNNLFHSEQ